MTIFILSQAPATHREGLKPVPVRVILDDRAHGAILETFETQAITQTIDTPEGPVEKVIKSAWRIAREKVDESKFYHVESFGWLPLEKA